MAEASGQVSWWFGLIYGVGLGLFMFFTMWMMVHKRRWRDRKLLARAALMPAEHIAAEPRKVRDMLAGEEGYVGSYEILTAKKNRRVFVQWDAQLKEAPKDPSDRFAPLRLRRLERGFSLAVRPGDEFRSGSVPWGWYAPVTEIVQAVPPSASQPN